MANLISPPLGVGQKAGGRAVILEHPSVRSSPPQQPLHRVLSALISIADIKYNTLLFAL